MKEESNVFVCKSILLMEYLVRQGFHLRKVRDSERSPKYKVFVFDSTPELEILAHDFILKKKVG